jgi:hypothetical protein
MCITTRITIDIIMNMNVENIDILNVSGSTTVAKGRVTNRKIKFIMPSFEVKLMLSSSQELRAATSLQVYYANEQVPLKDIQNSSFFQEGKNCQIGNFVGMFGPYLELLPSNLPFRQLLETINIGPKWLS